LAAIAHKCALMRPIFAASLGTNLTSRLSYIGMLSLSMYAGMGMGPSELAARYREYAAKCIAVAQGLQGEAEKLSLLDMAQAWLALADLALRNGHLQPVYETPEA